MRLRRAVADKTGNIADVIDSAHSAVAADLIARELAVAMCLRPLKAFVWATTPEDSPPGGAEPPSDEPQHFHPCAGRTGSPAASFSASEIPPPSGPL